MSKAEGVHARIEGRPVEAGLDEYAVAEAEVDEGGADEIQADARPEVRTRRIGSRACVGL